MTNFHNPEFYVVTNSLLDKYGDDFTYADEYLYEYEYFLDLSREDAEELTFTRERSIGRIAVRHAHLNYSDTQTTLALLDHSAIDMPVESERLGKVSGLFEIVVRDKPDLRELCLLSAHIYTSGIVRWVDIFYDMHKLENTNLEREAREYLHGFDSTLSHRRFTPGSYVEASLEDIEAVIAHLEREIDR